MKKTNRFLAYSLFLAQGLMANNLNGTTGLIQMPNARVNRDFSGSIFYSNAYPYSNYGVNFSVLPKLEVNAHLSNSKNKTDKILSLKLLLNPESEYLPAITYGMDDIWGDLSYASKYIALSKQISYFDFTLGYAIGRLGGYNQYNKYANNTYKFFKDLSFKDGNFFAGAKFNFKKDLNFLLEYAPIDYAQDVNKPKKKRKTKLNIGLNYNITKDFSTKLSLLRGNQLAFGFSYNYDLSKKHKTIKKISSYNDNIVSNLSNNDFNNIKTVELENSLWISAKNNSSFYDVSALLKATDAVKNSKDKDKFEYIYLDLNANDKKVFKINMKELEIYQKKDISNTYMKNAVIVENDKQKLYKEFLNGKKAQNITQLKDYGFSYDIMPSTKSYLLNDGNYLYTKAGINLNLSYTPFELSSLNSTIYLPLYNNMNKLDNTNGYDRYNKVYLDKFYLSLGKKFPNEYLLYSNIGFLSQKYFGVSLECQKTFLNEKIGFSLQYQNVKPRVKNKIFDTQKKTKDAKFINLYYQLSKENNTHLGLRIGEFLNNDKGYRIELSRTYKKFKFGAYFSRTKNDRQKNNTKGFYIKIPLGKKYFNNAKRSAPLYFDSISNFGYADFIDFDTSLYNKLSTENNLQIIKKNINILKQ